jgi:hypothetical protein
VRQTKNRQKGCKMLKKALTTTALATVLLTSSISANELATQGFSGSTAKVETIGAFDNIPTQNLNTTELEVVGEGWAWWDNIQSWYHDWRESERQIREQRNQDFYDGNDYNIFDPTLTGNSYSNWQY